MSNYKYFSKMYILEILRSHFIELCLFGTHVHGGARSKWSLWSLAENRKAKAHALLLTAKWKYFYGFLTFTDGEYTCEV